ncbi:MarR family transcriptional regulator [uncultured Shewanella sp.]|uniref:MarR family winged helix-turn-helix transcriptional regulator n=1 Tax=uncultured Shewanella sp. TaxID=173975 RepID=UPI002623BDBE|nr:MarR family transcriptional regulator [uncultured Shewanella sp.]
MSQTIKIVPELEASTSFIMGLAYKQFRTLANQALSAKLGISLEMLGALKVLAHGGEMPQQGLAEGLQRERSATKRLVDNCIKRELITSYKTETNKKAKYLVITEKGLQVKEQASAILAEIIEQFYEPLTTEERDSLLVICRKLIKDDIYLGND